MLSFIDFICKRSKTINNTIWNTENTRENSVTVYKGTINIILSYFFEWRSLTVETTIWQNPSLFNKWRKRRYGLKGSVENQEGMSVRSTLCWLRRPVFGYIDPLSVTLTIVSYIDQIVSYVDLCQLRRPFVSYVDPLSVTLTLCQLHRPFVSYVDLCQLRRPFVSYIDPSPRVFFFYRNASIYTW